jgi:hypothetical protein|tara:strand:- start:99 stop:425 length:327 start_codon:yes stop_codon:yes gene_type:complete
MSNGFDEKIRRAMELYEEFSLTSEDNLLQRCDDVTRAASRWLVCAPWVLIGMLKTQVLIESRGDDDLAKAWQFELHEKSLEVFIDDLERAIQNIRRIKNHDGDESSRG